MTRVGSQRHSKNKLYNSKCAKVHTRTQISYTCMKIFLFILIIIISVMTDIYRVSINHFPDYKHLLQENYVEYEHIFFTIT